jgi:hypothetical protein
VSAAHSHTPRLEKDAVLAELRAQDVIDRYQIQGRATGREFRTGICPSCGPRSRKDSVCINLDTGRWSCKAAGCSGDILDLVAGLNNLDAHRDFVRVLELAADIAGVGPGADPEAVSRALARRAAEQKAADEARARRKQAAIAIAGKAWSELKRHDQRGHRYLAIERGLDADALIERGLVRFGQSGDPFVALWSSGGGIRNIVRRCLAGDVKVLGMPGCPTSGTLVGRLCDLTRGALVVLTEGVIDTLTAALAWPHALVLGAHGASEMPTIAKAVAPRVHFCGGELLICGHNDPPTKDKHGKMKPGIGVERADEAMKHALEAGLVTVDGAGNPVARVRAVDIGGHKDLNDAYRAGWRP